MRDYPKPLNDDALHGLAGRIVKTILPHTEADPAALLGQFLAAFGNIIGREPHALADGARHGLNLFVCISGETSKARKGTSWKRIVQLFEEADESADPNKWFRDCQADGLSSGEGLIWRVRDPVVAAKPEMIGDGLMDEGAIDKRLTVQEAEFSGTLRVLERNGNTLSSLMRKAFDGGPLQTLTKNSPAKATDAHITIIAHGVREEIVRYLDRSEIAGGLGNRFLFVCANRSKLLPDGASIPEKALRKLRVDVRAAVAFARTAGTIERDEAARDLWHKEYARLSEGKPGLAGALTARAEAQVLRLSCIYALLDQSTKVRVEHLRAALAVWKYCEESVGYIFGDSTGDGMADEILRKLKAAPEGMKRSEILDAFGRHGADKIDRALRTLRDHGLASSEKVPTGGRSAEVWKATVGEKSDRSEERTPSDASLASLAASPARFPSPTEGWGTV